MNKDTPIIEVHQKAVDLHTLLRNVQTVAWNEPEQCIGVLIDDLVERARLVAFGLEDRTSLGIEATGGDDLASNERMKISPRIQQLYKKRLAIDAEAAAYVTPPDVDEDKVMAELFWNRRDKVDAEMMATPSITAADFAIKTIIDTECGGAFSDWDSSVFWKEARSLVGLPEPTVLTGT